MKAGYRILETRRPADDLVVGYLDVEFTYRDRDPKERRKYRWAPCRGSVLT